MTDQPQGERWVGVKEASDAWAGAATETLIEVAGHYRGVITYAELAEQVQARTGLRTRASFRSWIGGLLATVVARCHAQHLPPLTSLVVHPPMVSSAPTRPPCRPGSPVTAGSLTTSPPRWWPPPRRPCARRRKRPAPSRRPGLPGGAALGRAAPRSAASGAPPPPRRRRGSARTASCSCRPPASATSAAEHHRALSRLAPQPR